MLQKNYKDKYLRYKSKYLELKYGGSKALDEEYKLNKSYNKENEKDDIIYKKKKIAQFFKDLFNMLAKKNNCFLTGSFVFEDNNDRLYNFLTFGNSDDGNIGKCDKIGKQIAQQHWSLKYMEVFKRNSRVISPDLCFEDGKLASYAGCKNNNCLRLELTFDEDLDYLCGEVNNEIFKETKKTCIYYQFWYDNRRYVFLKLLPVPFNSKEQHLGSLSSGIGYVKGIMGTRLTQFENDKKSQEQKKIDEATRNQTFPPRDEVDAKYEYKNHDEIFYEELGTLKHKLDEKGNPDLNDNSYLDSIKYYNAHLRTGNEMFITEAFKDFYVNVSATTPNSYFN
jgi:hypothetical protein